VESWALAPRATSNLFTTGAALGGATEPQAVAASGSSSAAIVRRLCTYRSVTKGAWTIKVSCVSRAGGRVGRPRERRGATHNGWLSGCWSAVLGVGRVQVTAAADGLAGGTLQWLLPAGRAVAVWGWVTERDADSVMPSRPRRIGQGVPRIEGGDIGGQPALEAVHLRPQPRSLAVLASSEHAHGRLYALPLHQHTYRYQSYAADSPREALAYWPWWGGSVSGGSAGSRRCPHPTSPTPCAASDSKD
jgi:hypothetical protein